MKHIVIDVTCPLCGRGHKYFVVEQIVAVRNSAFARREWRPWIQGALQLRLPGAPVGQHISVSATCPVTGRVIKVSLEKRSLSESGLDPQRVSLASTSSRETEQHGGRA
jgi:hypothetical protein